jgi:polyisoprenoid-binding protein YceI
MNCFRTAAVLIAGLSVSSVSFAQKTLGAGAYSLDPAHSKVGFEIAHLVISTVEGRFSQFSGTLVMADKFENSSLNTTIDMSSIDTAMPDRDKHLSSPDFFDVKKFPIMTFKSTKIEGSPESFKVTGDLTIKGISKPVTLEGKYLGTVKDGYGNNKAAFNAKGKISRKDFGLTWNKVVEAGPVVGDDVTLDFKIQAKAENKVEPKK